MHCKWRSDTLWSTRQFWSASYQIDGHMVWRDLKWENKKGKGNPCKLKNSFAFSKTLISRFLQVLSTAKQWISNQRGGWKFALPLKPRPWQHAAKCILHYWWTGVLQVSFNFNSLWVCFCAQQLKCHVNVKCIVSRNTVMFVSVWKKKLEKILFTELGQVANESWWSVM